MIIEFSLNETEITISDAWQIVFYNNKEEKQKKIKIDNVEEIKTKNVIRKELIFRMQNRSSVKTKYVDELSLIMGKTIRGLKFDEKEDPDNDFIAIKSHNAFLKLRPNTKIGFKETMNNEILTNKKHMKCKLKFNYSEMHWYRL